MADGPRNLPSKKDVVLALLQGPSVFVHLDPRKKGVVVPANFRKQPQLVLQVGLNMAVQIPDLRVDDEGVSCTLSFSRSPFWCSLPWSAIYALVSEDGPGMVWPEDVPPEVAAQMQAAVTRQQPKRPRPKLAAVGPRSADSDTDDSSADAAPGEGSDARTPAPGEVQPSVLSLHSGGARQPLTSVPGGEARSPSADARQPSAGGADVVPIRPLPRKDKDADATAPVEADAEDTPRPPGPRAVPGKKPRRELPPYLRVIK